MPTRDEVKPQVLAALRAATGKTVVREPQTLWENLGMGPAARKAMAIPYTKLSTQYANGIAVSITAAGKLKTVKDSIDLVERRANGRT